MKVPFVDLVAQDRPVRGEIKEAVDAVISEGAFVGGRFVKAFEEDFSSYLGVRHTVGVGSGTDALFVALKSLGIGEGDEVITVCNTFIATSEAITRTGARVVFVDCDPVTYNISAEGVEKAITKKTKAVVPVHLYGQSADMGPILEIARRHDFFIVEDCAQAAGASHKGKKAGTFGDLGCFSFFPSKNLGAYGDGGAVVTNDEELARKVRMFANHGRTGKYDHEFEGINSRLDSIQAAILARKLKYLDTWNEERRKAASLYDGGLKGIVVTPRVSEASSHVYHLYVVRVGKRDVVRERLAEKGISTGIHYPQPLPLLRAYSYLGYKPGDFKNACLLKEEILSLPMYGGISEDIVGYVTGALRGILRKI